MTPSSSSNSPGPPHHNLSAGEGQASSWEQALYAATHALSQYPLTDLSHVLAERAPAA